MIFSSIMNENTTKTIDFVERICYTDYKPR